MILHLHKGRAKHLYMVDHEFIADISGLQTETEYGANAILRDKRNGIHWICETVEEVAELLSQVPTIKSKATDAS